MMFIVTTLAILATLSAVAIYYVDKKQAEQQNKRLAKHRINAAQFPNHSRS